MIIDLSGNSLGKINLQLTEEINKLVKNERNDNNNKSQFTNNNKLLTSTIKNCKNLKGKEISGP